MRIFVYGAGVLGSLYAAKLQEAGNDVTILARGKRLDEIKTSGIVLDHTLKQAVTVTQVKAVERLEPDEVYDLILVIMRRNQVDSILPALSANKRSPSILFMVNNSSGYEEWIQAVGRERLLIGFAGAGGSRKDGVVHYHIVSGRLQTTTIGEIDGQMTPRIKMLADLFQQAGFPTTVSSNMLAWQKYHVAWVSPIANALYMAGGDGRQLARRAEIVELMIDAVREGFKVLKMQGFPVTPSMIGLLETLPKPFLSFVLRQWMRTEHFDIVATRHALAASDEMRYLSDEFQREAQAVPIQTPSLNRLRDCF